MKKLYKKIAIIHDGFGRYGGSENTAYALIQLFPEAHIYTLWSDSPVLSEMTTRIHINKIVSFIAKLHKNAIKLFAYFYWESLDLSEYDLVISSSHSFSSKAVKTNKETRHICYCYTPPRYLYDIPSEHSLTKKDSVFTHYLFSWIRQLDLDASRHPDMYLAISDEVRRRIYRYYKRDSMVIYPPVDVPKSYIAHPNGSYYVYIGRLTKTKGVHLAVSACTSLRRRLLVVGDGPEFSALHQLAGATITFKRTCGDREKKEIMRHARALLFPALNEDFGIVPVEAMGNGIPVIAHNSGGPKETIIHNKTGILFDKWTTEGLIDGIHTFEKMSFDAKSCFKQAGKFSKKEFARNIRAVVSAL